MLEKYLRMTILCVWCIPRQLLEALAYRQSLGIVSLMPYNMNVTTFSPFVRVGAHARVGPEPSKVKHRSQFELSGKCSGGKKMFREPLTSGFCRVESEKNQSAIGLGYLNKSQTGVLAFAAARALTCRVKTFKVSMEKLGNANRIAVP